MCVCVCACVCVCKILWRSPPSWSSLIASIFCQCCLWSFVYTWKTPLWEISVGVYFVSCAFVWTFFPLLLIWVHCCCSGGAVVNRFFLQFIHLSSFPLFSVEERCCRSGNMRSLWHLIPLTSEVTQCNLTGCDLAYCIKSPWITIKTALCQNNTLTVGAIIGCSTPEGFLFLLSTPYIFSNPSLPPPFIFLTSPLYLYLLRGVPEVCLIK